MKAFTFTAMILAISLSFVALGHRPACAQGTAFTYQGRLDDGGSPANGPHDFVFRLFDAASGGAQIGSTVCIDNLNVIDGVFSAELDFGQQFATTGQRHLEIEVRSDTGLPCGDGTGLVVLSPRQHVTAAPMASHAGSAFTLAAADGSPANAVFVDNDGKVGVGTTAPAMHVHVKGTAPVMVLQDTASPSNQAGYISFWNNVPTETGWLGYGTTGSPQLSLVNARTGGDLRLYTGSGGHINFTSGSGGDINLVPGTGGDVGVGTFTPAAKLDVRGDVRLGSAGEYFAPAGPENLRILRGKVSSAGGVLFGSGFTASRSSAGVYSITFSPAFPIGQFPILTASAESSGAARFAMVNTPTHVATVIRIVNGSGTAVDADFYFIAAGPR
jgi:hypothetical protein